ncbi:MAG: BamA/TamA family outer membrane protein [Bacteroidales bacterium]|nr:BamA/TamA family outer membrane protein [Bacteroidales bacterium]MDT8430748.1 BamA/TamA family outer membrane protein [Bacteroidales bacterium]
MANIPDTILHETYEKPRNLRAFPFAAPAYTPELGPTLIAVMMVSFKTDPADSLIQRSSTPVNIGASLRGSYFLNTIISTYWLEDRLRIFGEVRFRNMPDHYWGVGFDKAAANKGRDESTSYSRRYWEIYPRVLWQFGRHCFLGVGIDYHKTQVRDPNPLMENDPDYIAFGPVHFNSGLGLIARYDSRDVPVNPWKGSLVDLKHMQYSEWFGGDNNFGVTTLDMRHFQEILRPGSTLAMQIKLQHATGEVPYTNMSMLGSPYDLRGYFLGHYRDRSMVFGIAEYRHQFLKRDGSPTRHGMVGWLGTGSIAARFGEFSDWLPNAGFGYRFEVQPRMNVRAEIGFGKESTGFYFSFNEAF